MAAALVVAAAARGTCRCRHSTILACLLHAAAAPRHPSLTPGCSLIEARAAVAPLACPRCDFQAIDITLVVLLRIGLIGPIKSAQCPQQRGTQRQQVPQHRRGQAGRPDARMSQQKHEKGQRIACGSTIGALDIGLDTTSCATSAAHGLGPVALPSRIDSLPPLLIPL